MVLVFFLMLRVLIWLNLNFQDVDGNFFHPGPDPESGFPELHVRELKKNIFHKPFNNGCFKYI